MAIEGFYFSLLTQVIETLQRKKPKIRSLILGYPDLLVPKKALNQLFGDAMLASLKKREDSRAIWKYHGFTDFDEPIFDSIDLLSRLNVQSEVIDVAKIRGIERIVDLNRPITDEFRQQYDLVIDTGTCEHCFNVAQAFSNACDALTSGGFLLHAAPLNRFNHGFWCFNPTAYFDFFSENGFQLHLITGVSGNLVDGFHPFEIDPVEKFDAPPESALYVIAERREIREFRWPVQRKYLGLIK